MVSMLLAQVYVFALICSDAESAKVTLSVYSMYVFPGLAYQRPALCNAGKGISSTGMQSGSHELCQAGFAAASIYTL